MRDATKPELLQLLITRANTLFIPIDITSCEGFYSNACAIFKKIFKAAQTNGHWVMASGQPEVFNTWNMPHAST